MKKLKFTLENNRRLFVRYFENWSSGSGGVFSKIIPFDARPKEIHQMLKKLQDKEPIYEEVYINRHRKIFFSYWVNDYEIMKDNRSDFGHSDCQTSRYLKTSIPLTYTRGSKITIKEALELEELSDKKGDAYCSLWNLVHSELGIFLEDLNENQLKKEIIMIPGDKNRKSFFGNKGEVKRYVEY